MEWSECLQFLQRFLKVYKSAYFSEPNFPK
jgi:hypothetical protein